MNIFAGLETFLYVISSMLFYPVVTGLVIMVFWMVMSAGGILHEYTARQRGIFTAVTQYKEIIKNKICRKDCSTGDLDIRLERRLQEAELNLIKQLDRVRFAIRVGPALGLMGTLIPMGIALSALARGDMPAMAGNMVTAFTTTVVGLACGVAAYLMSLVKEKWVRADMREMEYYTEIVLRNSDGQALDSKMEVNDEIFKEAKTV